MLEVMSTRSIIVLKDKYYENYIYMHYDGYPSCRLVEMQEFLKWNEPRNDDVIFSVANFMLWYKLNSIRNMKYYSDDKKITALDDILTPLKQDSDIHRGIGIVDREFEDYEYKYVVDFDKKTIHVTGHKTDVTVEFGQVVEFGNEDEIIEPQMPAN